MPIYPGRKPGSWRIVISVNGKGREKVVYGSRVRAEYEERQFYQSRGIEREQRTVPEDPDPVDAANAIEVLGMRPPFVYMVQDSGTGYIKIGYAKRLAVRISMLQCGNPKKLRLLCVIPGGRALEWALHQTFDEHHVKGEWFEPTPELMALIDEASDIIPVRRFRKSNAGSFAEVAVSRSLKRFSRVKERNEIQLATVDGSEETIQ